MTRSHEKGDNEFTDAAKREALRTGEPVDEILARWLAEATKAKDKERKRKIVQAQKYILDRNQSKRRGRRR
jgi:hypothetical protein